MRTAPEHRGPRPSSEPTQNKGDSRGIPAEVAVNTAHAGKIIWRGGLNQALAKLVARDYERLQKPPAGLGKLGVYKEWGSALGVGHLDVDGSRVRKGTGRLIQQFERAHTMLSTPA
jgi:hypothetical protein